MTSPTDARRERAVAWLAASACALLGVALAARSWRAWPDVLVDFGRELYVPWRIASGDRLYADLAWFNGPLSPHWNALLFSWFGTGLDTLVWANLAVLAGIAALAFAILRRIGDAVAAGVGVAVFLCGFAFAHLVATGNYNFATPYSHEMTHGVLLSLVALWLAGRFEPGRRAALLWTGLALGGVALTKAEVMLAAAAGVTAVCVATLRARGAGGREVASALGWLAVGAIAPVAAALAGLVNRMPIGVAAQGLLGSWPVAAGGDAIALRFYSHWLGVDAPWRNAGAALVELAAGLALLAPFAWLDRRVARARPAAWTVAAFAAVFAVAWLVRPSWPHVGRSLALATLGGTGLAGLRWWRAAGGPAGSAASLALGFAVFAFVLLAKMILFTRVFHYGFALAAPAVWLLVVGLCVWIPDELRRRGGVGVVFRGAALGLLATAAIGWLQASDARYREKDLRVGAGRDAFLARSPDARPIARRAAAVSLALAEIERRVSTDGTVLVLPEGVMLNYLARRRSPTAYVNFLPPELLMFGEDEIVRALDTHPPDLVLVVHKDTTEYGSPRFGEDYGRALWGWVRQRYVQASPPIGDPPLGPGPRFGIAILEPRGG